MKKFLNIAICLGALIPCSCLNESGMGDCPLPGAKQVEITFGLAVANAAEVHTRTAGDSDIENVDLLVFDENSCFLNRIPVDELTTGSDGWSTFTCRVDVSTANRFFRVVANGRDASGAERVNFSALTVGMAEATALPLLATPTVDDGFLPPVLWGKVLPAQPISNNFWFQMGLQRSAALLELQCDAATAANGMGDFVLTQFSVCGASSRGSVASSTFSIGVSSLDEPTTCATAVSVDYCTAPHDIWAAAGGSLWLYERKNTKSDCMGIIIRASWKGEEGYYKVAPYANGVPMSIVRNHRYILHLVGCSGPGYATVGEAMTNAPSNALKVDLVDTRTYITDMVADGQFELGISAPRFELWGAAAQGVRVAYVYSSFPGTPTAVSNASWLSNLRIGTDASGIRCLLADFAGTAGASAAVTLRSGTLSRTIDVSWQARPSVSEDSDSWVAQIAAQHAGTWDVSIEEGAASMALHPYLSTAAGWSAGSSGFGFASSLDSRMAEQAYLHVSKAASGKVGYLRQSIHDGSTLTAKRILVSQ